MTIGGDLTFSSAAKLDWTQGTVRQRLLITDDSSENTAVFTFQQSTNSGSAYSNLFIIKDNGTVEATTFSGSGASLTSLNASNISSGTLSADRLATSGATAGSYGPSAAVSGSNGTTMNVPYITVDDKGRVTTISNKVYTAVNTWRGIQDNLTSSTNITESLSAKQGYLLANGSARDNTKLEKITYEYNKEIAFGSSGKLLIGKFPCYDSNVTIQIFSTTSVTYHAIAILATQNINTTGGGTFTWNTYGDSANTVTPNLFAKYVSGSNVIEIYFSPSSQSKNYIHISCVALRSAPTNICENVDSIPTEATRQPTNTLLSISTSGDSGTVNGHTVLSDVPANAVFTDTKSFTITANATDGYWDLTGTNGTNAVTYALTPYSSKQSGANFYTGTTNPDGTTRLNYNGYLYATKLYSNGTEVSVSGHNHNSSYLTAIGYDSTNKKIYYTKNGSNTDVVTFGSNAFDSTSYLPLAGGTMTGDIAFTSIGASGTTGTSKKITWSGSTDNASIYYTVPSADAGRLVINTGDDTNCLVAWAYKDSIKAYINNSTPSFYPATTNTGSIGTSSVVWANIYATTFNGSILKLSNYMNSILTGAGTAAVTSGTKMPALWRFNLGIASPTEGDIVTIKIPVAGHGNGVFVSLDNGTTYYPVSVSGTGALTTHYAKDQIITLVCVDSGGTNSIYPAQATINSNSYTLGTAANITGKHWCIVNYYDSGNTNTATRQKVRSTNGNYSLLFADPVVGTADNNTNYYTYRNDSIYVNPSTGNVYATTFNGALSGNATTATSATNDSDGNAINTTYVKKVESTDEAIVRFNGTDGTVQNSTATINDNGTMIIKSQLVIDPSYDTSLTSYNQGIRINKASNNWSTIVLGGTKDSISGTEDGSWLIGRRGASETNFAATGDLSICEQGVAYGLTIKKDKSSVVIRTSVGNDVSQLLIRNEGTIAATKYGYIINGLSPNMAATSNSIILFGIANSTSNQGYIGFHYEASGSNSNYLTLGLYAKDNLMKIFPTGQVNITTNITSSSTSTGSLVVAGGAGIGGKLYVGDILTLAGTTSTTAGLGFSRTGGPNYINVPTNGILGISIGGMTDANIRLAVYNDKITSYDQNNTIDLGTSTSAWKSVHSKAYVVEEKVTLQWNATDQSLDFIFA